ncbi:glycosyltransferase family 2 protein [Celeribacter halophilus]|uniref:glycosyltransferase family 2 protein n=1 Tax=Celeribacter halophilus TaxID=576117 RepID=UPI003A8D4FA3
MRQPPLVSVIIPAHNAAGFLTRAVHSVQAQSVADWEALIIDDASEDETRTLAAQFQAQDPRIRALSLAQNQGAAAARNTGIDAAQGRYIAFLDSDDSWLPDKLARQLALINETGAALCYGAFWRDRGARKRLVKPPARLDRAQLLRGNAIGCLTAMYDRAQLGRRYFPDMALRQDWALWLDILKETGFAVGVTEPVATYHARAGSLSSNKWKALAANWRFYRDVEGIGAPKATWLLGESSLRRVLRG